MAENLGLPGNLNTLLARIQDPAIPEPEAAHLYFDHVDHVAEQAKARVAQRFGTDSRLAQLLDDHWREWTMYVLIEKPRKLGKPGYDASRSGNHCEILFKKWLDRVLHRRTISELRGTVPTATDSMEELPDTRQRVDELNEQLELRKSSFRSAIKELARKVGPPKRRNAVDYLVVFWMTLYIKLSCMGFKTFREGRRAVDGNVLADWVAELLPLPEELAGRSMKPGMPPLSKIREIFRDVLSQLNERSAVPPYADFVNPVNEMLNIGVWSQWISRSLKQYENEWRELLPQEEREVLDDFVRRLRRHPEREAENHT